ncbi:MAG: RNA-binding protein [Proteobacteria bacterium]|nr:RNA-binding protein [Pseudomonadota bacterium]
MTRGGAARTRETPERRCIASGESGPTGRLIRFVLGPEAVVVPDLAARLPGRGVWLTAERALVERAVAKGLFSRAFKAPAAAPGDLADRLEALLARRLIDLIGLARKAGQAVTGFEKVRARLKEGAAGVLVQASDGAADGKAKLARMAGGVPGEVRVIEVLDSTELGLAFGRDFAIHAALDRGGFADRVIAEAERLGGLRPAGAMTDRARRGAVRTSGEQQGGPATVPGQGDR